MAVAMFMTHTLAAIGLVHSVRSKRRNEEDAITIGLIIILAVFYALACFKP